MSQTAIKPVLMTGNEVVVKAAMVAGADMFTGYPITPSTEILSHWAEEAKLNKDLIFFQAEDEPAAGFSAIGGVLTGRKAWTATAGVGNILMQDPLSMAEAMRIPIVTYIGQRGGPSTGTVIYSQQELNLTRMGGNGEGLRIVYAPSNLQELYDLTIKAFNAAWKYRFPSFILSDGYLGKTYSEVNLYQPKKTEIVEAESTFLNSKKSPQNLRNCYSQEHELNEVLRENFKDYSKVVEDLAEAEYLGAKNPDVLICAWGSVGNAAKKAVEELDKENINAGLFRPVTMRPFPTKALQKASLNASKILIVESANGQFGRIVRETLCGIFEEPIHRFYKPAMGITPEEIEAQVEEIL